MDRLIIRVELFNRLVNEFRNTINAVLDVERYIFRGM